MSALMIQTKCRFRDAGIQAPAIRVRVSETLAFCPHLGSIWD